jgi:hypothetical protein
MTTKPAWSHLPNAKHIDAVLADARKRPGAWDAARTAARRAAWGAVQDAAWTAAWDEARDAVRGAAWDAVRAAVWDAVWDAAWGALAALIAWDSSADLLECTPDVLRTMIDLAEPPVCHQAALLLPYAIVRFGTWP